MSSSVEMVSPKTRVDSGIGEPISSSSSSPGLAVCPFGFGKKVRKLTVSWFNL
jgi:hypothetical protein